jgi:hypothetical protein
MQLYSVQCEAPGGGYGESAVLVYGESLRYIREVKYLDLIFDVWLGGDLVQDVECYCVTADLWDHLEANEVKGVSVREMTVTPGEHVNELHPGRIIPVFKELVLPRGARGKQTIDGFRVEQASIPHADMFTGTGMPLIVTDRARQLMVNYGVREVEFTFAAVVESEV